MEHFSKYLAICVNNVVNVYNPDYLVINCDITRRFPSIMLKMQEQLNCELSTQKKIVGSTLNNSVLYGGICVAVKEFLHINDFTAETESSSYYSM